MLIGNTNDGTVYKINDGQHAPGRHEERIPNRARPEPAEGIRPRPGSYHPAAGNTPPSGTPLFGKRGPVSLLPVPTHDYGTNRPETAAAASATDSRRRAGDP